MREGTATLDIVTGLLAGLIATRVTDWVQRPLWQATPDSEKAREPDAPDGSSAMTAARKTAEICEVDAGDDDLDILKNTIHYGLGAGWGLLYVVLRRNCSMGILTSGMLTGTALSLIIDEALNPALEITPPADAYPMSSHIRGLLAHLVYGLAVAGATEALHLAVKQRLSWTPNRLASQPGTTVRP